MKKIKFWDCDVRIGKANNPMNSKVYTSSQIVDLMDYYEIDKSLVYHKESLLSPVDGNRQLLSVLQGSNRLIGCAVLSPNYTGEFGKTDDYFKMLKTSGFGAIRLFPVINGYPLKDFCLDDIMIHAQKYSMPVIIDEIDLKQPLLPVSTWDYSPSYSDIYDLAMTYKSVHFIIIMPGMLTNRMMTAIMHKCDNVYFECATFGYKHIEMFCEQFSAKKLIFGSYAPVLDPGAYISYILYADISEREKEMIAARNLESLLGGGNDA